MKKDKVKIRKKWSIHPGTKVEKDEYNRHQQKEELKKELEEELSDLNEDEDDNLSTAS